MGQRSSFALILAISALAGAPAFADTFQFFSAAQPYSYVSSGVTSDTVNCDGYYFSYTMDKLFTGGTGQVIGRTSPVTWPTGIQAQAVTTPPPGKSSSPASFTIKRKDGGVFDFPAFTVKLMANTAGAGGAVEVMPLLNGNDGLQNPLAFDVTGNYGQSFSFEEFPPYYWQTSTAPLKGFDTYKLSLYVDFALTSLTLQGAPTPEPSSAVVLLAGAGVACLRRRRR